MRFKLGMAGLIVAGLVMLPGTASAHGNGECRWFFDTGTAVWSGSQRITQGQTNMLAAGAINSCAYVGIENSAAGRVVFWGWINNSAATAIVWTQNGRVHGCTVDHDQTFTNGRWFTGFNVSCSNS